MPDTWPFVLLVAVFLGFSIRMARAMRSGKDSFCRSLMKRQIAAIETQIALQSDMPAKMRRQSGALENRR